MDTAGVTAAAQSDRQHQPERLSRLSRRTMAADVGGISTNQEADDLVQQPAQSKSLGRVSKQSSHNSEMADTCATAGDAQTVNPAAQSDDPTDLQPATDDATPDEGVGQAAEADAVAPSIPAEIPNHVVLPRLADRSAVIAPADAIGDALAAYNILRAFSWQIRLSPFAFEELCAALFNPNPSPLMDELHICLIRSLAFDENKAERAQRGLDLGCLDSMSWPEYVWEYLHMHEDDLRHHRWTQQQTPGGPGRGTPDKSRGSSPNAEITFKSGLSDSGAKTSITITGRSPSKLSRAAAGGSCRAAANGPSGAGANGLAEASDAGAGANGHSGAASGGPEAARSLNGLVTAVEDDQEIQNIRALMRRQPFRHKTQLEYYALPAGIKAAILVSLVNDLLDISSVRHEIDKREAAGQWVAGKGGAGGSFPMRSEEERARRADVDSAAEGNDDDSEEEGPAAPPELFEDDGNTDLCVLCGLGGSLLCCDGCPAAYHMRCIGETAKSIPEGEWLCPECSVGGRGETAGLRVPRAGLNQHKQPHWMCHGCLFRSARPEPQDIGGQAREEGLVPMDKWSGEIAAAEAKALRKIRGEEKPHPSSIHGIRDPPVVKVLASLSAEGYVNRYRNSWTAAVAATKTFVDDMARKKGRPPAGGARVSIPMADLPVPVPLSRFQWPSSAGKGQRGNLVRCGQCHMCRNPLMKKPCLHPIVPRGLDGLDEGTSAPKLMTAANYAMRLEREVWGALDGPWGSDTWMGWRRDWAQKVRTATTAEPIAHAILELEALLRPAVFTSIWGPSSQVQPRPSGAPPRKGPAGQKPTPKPGKAPATAVSKSGRLNRAASAASDAPSAGRRRNYKEDSDSCLSESEEEVDLFAAEDAHDPTIVDNVGQTANNGWTLNQRNKWADSFKVGHRLPQDAAKRLARRGGIVRVPNVKYNAKQLTLQPRLAWRGAMQAARTASELALQLRKLDSHIQWEALKRPLLDADSPYASAEVLGRRPAIMGMGWDYLVQMPLGEGHQTLTPALGSAVGAISSLSDAALSQQAPLIAESARRASSAEQTQLAALSANQPDSALPDQTQASTAVHDTSHNPLNGSLTWVPPAISSHHLDPSSATAPVPSQQSAEAMSEPVVEAAQSSVPAKVTQSQRGSSVQPEQDALQQTATEAAAEGSQHTSPLPSQTHHPTAALTPFDSQPAPKQASSLSSLIPHAQHRPASAAASGQAQGQVARTVGAGPSREGTPNPKSPAKWVHESTLPLWLVKSYEEKRRRDVAMVAARAAQQAQREANRTASMLSARWNAEPSEVLMAASSIFKTKRQEAKAAADAAAAAAADACAVCEKLYGDDPEKDDLWIACDRCNRWYHGACVDLTQEMVDNIPEDKKWECPECASVKIERRKVAVERARLKRVAQGRALVSVPSGSDAGLEDQPGTSKRETKKSRRPKAAPKSGKKRKAPDGSEVAGEAEEEGSQVAELYCICRQPDDSDREFIECDSCSQWYHPDCVGISLQDMAEDDKFICPVCTRLLQKQQRLEQRRIEAEAAAEMEREAREAQAARKAKLAALDMSDWPRNWSAAVQRVLETVLKLPEAGMFAEPVLMDEAPGYRELIATPMDLGTVSGRAKADAYDTPLEALADVRQVWQNCRMYNAEGSNICQVCQDAENAFDANWTSARLPLPPPPPLPPSLLPKKQSRAGTKRQRDNAREPSSSGPQPSSGGRPARSAGHRQADAVPSTSKAAATADANGGSKRRLVVKPPRQRPEKQEEDSRVSSSSEAEISDSDGSHERRPRIKLTIKGRSSNKSKDQADSAPQDSAADLSRAQKVVKGVLKLKAAAPFSRPVNEEEVPGYEAAVKQPMDLGSVLEKLKNAAYTSLGEVLGDVDLVWANCRSFNEPDSDICDLADQAQQALRMRWQQEGLPTVTPIPPCARKQKKDGKKRALDAGASGSHSADQPLKKPKVTDPQAAAAELSKAHKAVKALLKLKVAAIFSAPVSEEEVPGYGLVIQNPMDLGTVLEKLRIREYASAGDVYEDVERIWHNCHTFNEPESDICTTASEAQQAFHARWQQQGLLQHEVKPDKTKSGRSSKQAAPAAEAAAGQGGKKQSGTKGKPEAATAAASGKGKSVADDRGHNAQPVEKGVSAPSFKQKRGNESVATAKAAASSAQKSDTKQLAPEKLSASARLRKGLPPTPPVRISPRGAVATSAGVPDGDATAAAKIKGKTKPSAKGSAASAGNVQVKAGTDEPVLRRTSSRLK
ncbi:hypothetical protein WJX77_005620 [Trebouxia sp. C0004]